MGSYLHRTGVRLTLAGICACVALGAGLLTASGASATSPVSARLITYITGLNTASPFVWISLPDGSAPQRLGRASSALISPDGAQVAAVTLDKQSNAWTLSLYPTDLGGGQSITVLNKRPQVMQLLAWSPDSRLLLLTLGTGPAQLMVVDTTTRPATSHQIASGSIYQASFAPGTSDAVVYARAQPGKSAVNIYTTMPAGTPTRQLTHDGRSEYPLWCPSGIIYSRQTPRKTSPYPSLQLWQMNADGSGRRQLTHLKVDPKLVGLTPVGCSYNGQHLLANYVGPPGANVTEPWTVDLSGPVTARDLTGAGSGYIGDAISRDGATILVTKGTAIDPVSIETFPWSGGKPKTIVKQGAYASWDQ